MRTNLSPAHSVLESRVLSHALRTEELAEVIVGARASATRGPSQRSTEASACVSIGRSSSSRRRVPAARCSLRRWQ